MPVEYQDSTTLFQGRSPSGCRESSRFTPNRRCTHRHRISTKCRHMGSNLHFDGRLERKGCNTSANQSSDQGGWQWPIEREMKAALGTSVRSEFLCEAV
jgi:hypothetical protein